MAKQNRRTCLDCFHMKVNVRLSNGGLDRKPWFSRILWDEPVKTRCAKGQWDVIKRTSMRYLEPGISKAKYLKTARTCEEFDGDGVA